MVTTHDPFCPVVANPVTMILHSGTEIIVGSYCQCELIAKVRADCLEKVEGAYVVGSDGEALTPSHPEYSHDGTETWNSAIDLAVAYMTGKID